MPGEAAAIQTKMTPTNQKIGSSKKKWEVPKRKTYDFERSRSKSPSRRASSTKLPQRRTYDFEKSSNGWLGMGNNKAAASPSSKLPKRRTYDFEKGGSSGGGSFSSKGSRGSLTESISKVLGNNKRRGKRDKVGKEIAIPNTADDQSTKPPSSVLVSVLGDEELSDAAAEADRITVPPANDDDENVYKDENDGRKEVGCWCG